MVYLAGEISCQSLQLALALTAPCHPALVTVGPSGILSLGPTSPFSPLSQQFPPLLRVSLPSPMVGIPKSRWLLGPPSLPCDQRVVQSRPLPEGIFEEGHHGPPLGGWGGRRLCQIYIGVVARDSLACSEPPCLLWRLHSKWVTPKPVLGTPTPLSILSFCGTQRQMIRVILHQHCLPRQGSKDGMFEALLSCLGPPRCAICPQSVVWLIFWHSAP